MYPIVKRLFDIVFSLLGIVFLIPIGIVVKIAYLCTGDTYTIFYTQPRIGRNGRVFKIVKFRSMVPNAEQELVELMAKDEAIAREYAENKKIVDDPRVTKVGRIIRRWSIDEMPQFLNVFWGTMSIVGNRPYLLGEKKEMRKYYDQIVKVKPGITGLWQISGHNDVSFKSRLELEATYAELMCFSLDAHIAWRTIRAMLGGE
ncbi:sugar transferase [Candidatus Saccharibacteria bacterium]|nr:sugar transferase [Candidatus Saccharibacteria bacterium]